MEGIFYSGWTQDLLGHWVEEPLCWRVYVQKVNEELYFLGSYSSIDEAEDAIKEFEGNETHY